MFLSVCYALAACFLWGLAFVVPSYMEGYTSLEIVLGRYAVYGIISLFVFIKAWCAGRCRYGKRVWTTALVYALCCTIVYYICIVIGITYSSAALSALIAGTAPITIAFYGNWLCRECNNSQLLLPSIMILAGLLLINWQQLFAEETTPGFAMGLFFNVLALVFWTWFVVSNARFLKDNQFIDSGDWSTMLGVATLAWVILCGAAASITTPHLFSFEHFSSAQPHLIAFILGCCVLGLFSSFIGSLLWNKASVTLPVALSGQLMAFMTVFGLLFVYAVEMSLPPMIEMVGIVLMLGAVAIGHRTTNREPKFAEV